MTTAQPVVDDPFDSAAHRVVDWLRVHTPLRQWSVSRVTDGRQVHLHVSGPGPLQVGESMDWLETLCRRMVRGAAHVVPDLSQDPDYADLDLTTEGTVVSYAGVPVYDSDGGLFGVLCGVGDHPLPSPDVIDTSMLELMSGLLTDVLVTSRAHLEAADIAMRAQSEADTDALTGLLNRRGWGRLAETVHVRHRSLGDPYSVVVARLGGDEFCVLLRDCPQPRPRRGCPTCDTAWERSTSPRPSAPPRPVRWMSWRTRWLPRTHRCTRTSARSSWCECLRVRPDPIGSTMASMPRLRTASPHSPGWTRRRVGRGFSYLGLDGRRLAADDADRCRRLVIPPAWEQVWICPHPNGHIQATGTDAAGRRQYLYHSVWRRHRDEAKHQRVLEMAARLPAAREHVSADLALPGMPQQRALAAAFRLLDLGFFRVGGESYAEENGSHGLATIKKSHVRLRGTRMEFTFMAKSSKEVAVALVDEQARAAVDSMRRRRSGGDELLAWRDGRRWRDVTSDDIRAYVKQVVGGDATVKDFRTWHGTVLAAVALAVSTHAAETPTARKRAVARAMREVSDYLGNTPAVARASYVDPRVIDLFEDGITIEQAFGGLGAGTGSGPATHGPIEEAVLRLLTTSPQARDRARRRTALAATG